MMMKRLECEDGNVYICIDDLRRHDWLIQEYIGL
jgi:hypothetical protein